ncbi:MAG: hypothetical protein HYU97_05160 [Deltaproteobacteria bacterium]|nr:hypothetical protein [Deltaproteobacteria bacterium]
MFDLPSILCGIFFSMVGLYAWRYGRQQQSGRHMLLGVALLAFGYFIPNVWLALAIGTLLTTFLFWP